MLDLSPTKILIILVVAVILLGPKRLPHLARQLGAGWRKLRLMRDEIDQEIRRSAPDLPTSQEIVRFARSPLRMLDHLADMPEGRAEDGLAATQPGAATGSTAQAAARSAGASAPATRGGDPAARDDTGPRPGSPRATPPRARPSPAGKVDVRPLAGVDTDDPTLN